MEQVLGAASVGFSLQLSSVYLTHLKLAAALCRDACSLSYDGYCVLAAMAEAGRAVRAGALADYLMLAQRYTLRVLSSLENMGLVAKRNDPLDARSMELHLTPAGKRAADRCSGDLQDLLCRVFWNELPSSELHETIQLATRQSLDGLRGHPASIETVPERNKHVLLDSYVFWRVEVSNWRQIARQTSDLCFSEYRVLRCIAENGVTTPAQVGDTLLMAKAHVSEHRATLFRKGLVKQVKNPLDARSLLLDATPEGRLKAESLSRALDVETRAAHQAADLSAAVVTEAWVYRMYLNLRRNSLPIQAQ